MLEEAQWRALDGEHRERVDELTAAHRGRSRRRQKHPVEDFLFTYYSHRPAQLRRWHPGPDVVLLGDAARERLAWRWYREAARAGGRVGVRVDVDAFLADRGESVAFVRELLSATARRPAQLGCFGLHEWAMVYRQTPDQVRHNAWPLRFSPAELATIVEQAPLCCTHFDAFRFFTAPARPRNKLQPTRSDALRLEQRGCLHANMDLYKWAFKLAPYSPAELIADCFELARDIREIDMRASPYDLRALGFEPIAIETEIGRGEYERWQRQFADRGEPLRLRLIALCDRLLAG